MVTRTQRARRCGRSTRRPRPAGDRGFTMVEVLVAMLLVAIVLTGLAALQITTIRQVSLSDRSGGALRLAQSIIERYEAVEFADLPMPTPGWQDELMRDEVTPMHGVWENGGLRDGKPGPFTAQRLVEDVGQDRLITVRVTWLDLMPGNQSTEADKYRTLETSLTLRRRPL